MTGQQKILSSIEEYDIDIPIMLKRVSEILQKKKTEELFVEVGIVYSDMLIRSKQVNDTILNRIEFVKLSDQAQNIRRWEEVSEVAAFYISKVREAIKGYPIGKVGGPAVVQVIDYIEKMASKGNRAECSHIIEHLSKNKRGSKPRKRIMHEDSNS